MSIKNQHIKKKSGFTLIELLISMAIFGFLVYVISAILVVIVNILYTSNQESFLRQNLEAVISTMTQDIHFAVGVPSDCSGGSRTCIDMNIPSTSSSGIALREEQIAWDSSLFKVTKDANINIGSGKVDISAANIKVTNVIFDIEQGNVLVTLVGQINGPIGKNNMPTTITQKLSAVIQYNK